MSLHDDIMNIPVAANMAEIGLKEHMISYKEGHRDARHAAAELALRADRRIEELEKALQDLIWAVSSDSLDAVIVNKSRALNVLYKEN